MSEVFSTPCVPMPADTEFDQFFQKFIHGLPGELNSQPQKLIQQAPQQPLFDNFDSADDSTMMITDPGTVVKREHESGFLDAWGNMTLDQRQTEDIDMDRYTPEQKKRIESNLVKEELHCHLKLKMMKEGKEFSSEAEDLQSSKDFPISEETRELQRVRRQKNREAAKKCRQKKKAGEREQEQKLREAQSQINELRKKLTESQREYSGLLECFPNMPCFLAYLRQNRHLVRSPSLKPMLQRFVQAHGGAMTTGMHAAAAPVSCCAVAAPQPCRLIDQSMGCGIEL